MILNPTRSVGSIVLMCSTDNPGVDYGLKIDKESGEILCIKKSIHTHHLFEYLCTL